jgi:hypothetical protein
MPDTRDEMADKKSGVRDNQSDNRCQRRADSKWSITHHQLLFFSLAGTSGVGGGCWIAIAGSSLASVVVLAVLNFCRDNRW